MQQRSCIPQDVFRGKASIQEVKDLQAARPDPGNAPPMRALPLAFLAPADLERLAELNADATHPHPKDGVGRDRGVRCMDARIYGELTWGKKRMPWQRSFT